jgi:hypothetical protein
MNTYTAHEQHAAAQLQAKAETLVCTYAEPRDAAAARLALLMQATEQEAFSQNDHRFIKLIRRIRVIIEKQKESA